MSEKIRRLPASRALALLRGPAVHAKQILARCGLSPAEIRKLIRGSKMDTFDSGMYIAANAAAKPLLPKQRILATEMLVQIHHCTRALQEKRWHDAVAAAQLLGEARGALFWFTSEYDARARGAPASARTKNRKTSGVMKEALKVYQSLPLEQRPTIKVERLWRMVRASLKKKRRWCCQFKAFAKHWRAIKNSSELAS